MTEATPSIWLVLLCVLAASGFGMWLGRIGSSTTWKPFVHFGAACLGFGEPAVLFLYNNDKIAIDQAFRIGALLAIAGSLLLSVGIQRAFKVPAALRRSSH
jgi:hypothetical protein